jgi:hypothetical protein
MCRFEFAVHESSTRRSDAARSGQPRPNMLAGGSPGWKWSIRRGHIDWHAQ